MEPVEQLAQDDADEADSISLSLHGFNAEIVIDESRGGAPSRWREIFDTAMQTRARAVLAETLERAGTGPAGGGGKNEVAILLTDDAAMMRLNASHRGRNSPTNVLAFREDDDGGDGASREGGMLGNIALASGVIAKEADELGIAVADHVLHLLVHGMLHLLGHTHDDDGPARRMEALEVEILGAVGIASPYGEQ